MFPSFPKLMSDGKWLALGVSVTFYYFSAIIVLSEVLLFGILLGAYIQNYWVGVGIPLAGLCLSWFNIIRKAMHWVLFVFVLSLGFYTAVHLGPKQQVPLALIFIMITVMFLLAVNYEFFFRVPNLIERYAIGGLYEKFAIGDDK